jgi:isopropylmalate/homocitrate/citramalate synthase
MNAPTLGKSSRVSSQKSNQSNELSSGIAVNCDETGWLVDDRKVSGRPHWPPLGRTGGDRRRVKAQRAGAVNFEVAFVPSTTQITPRSAVGKRSSDQGFSRTQATTFHETTMRTERIRFADCTLRDGEQAPGVFFTLDEKLAIADLLDAAGVDILDAGMPSVSDEERATLEALLGRSYRAKIAATVRASRQDIDLALDCGLQEIFLFMPVSPQHLKHKFSTTLRDAQSRIDGAVDYAVSRGLCVHFVAEDAVRADPVELAPTLDRVSRLGAASAIVCDTVGVMRPETMTGYINLLTSHMQSDITLGIHCHNDYGLATANTLAAINAGCTLVTGTINGLGERAGNAPLEELICALDNLYDMRLDVDKSVLPRLCEKVAMASGVFLSPTKPIVGLNVFRHESGVHVDGMLKDPSTYESLNPDQLGRKHEYILGKHSGRGLIELLLSKQGIQASPEVTTRILNRVKSAKASTDKAPFSEMSEQLHQFWSRYLSFGEDRFWRIAFEELSYDRKPISIELSPVPAQRAER